MCIYVSGLYLMCSYSVVVMFQSNAEWESDGSKVKHCPIYIYVRESGDTDNPSLSFILFGTERENNSLLFLLYYG